jgi:hypothetical protein
LLLVQSQTHKVGMKIWFEVLEHAPLHSKLRAPIEVLRAHGAHIACDDFGTQEWRMLTGLVEYLLRLGMKRVETLQHIESAATTSRATPTPCPLSRWA